LVEAVKSCETTNEQIFVRDARAAVKEGFGRIEKALLGCSEEGKGKGGT
jgi:hypothetical protein